MWLDAVEVRVGQQVRWDLGTREVWARRSHGQWLVGGREVGDESATIATVEVSDAAGEAIGAEVRVAVEDGAGVVRVVPRPPHRALVARPQLPLTVPSGTTSRVYLGIPVWLQIEADGVVLHELPSITLSDTWFGTPLDGELCLATRTRLSMALDEMGRRAYRAVCTVDIENGGDEPLVLERLRLPAPSLPIWCDDDGMLWSSPVRLIRQKGEDMAEVQIRDRAPDEASGVRRIGEPRQPHGNGLVSRVFNAMWLGARR